MGINEVEFMNQHREELLNKGNYIQVEIVVGEDNPLPYIACKGEHISSKEVAIAIHCLKHMAKDLLERYPETKLLQHFIKGTDLRRC